jgi:hypothetical protein
MMAVTHSIIAAAGTSLILSTANPMALGLAILGSQLPDLDSTNSTIGKIFFPVSSWIEDRFPHRSITHSLLATATLAVLSLSIGYYFLGNIWMAIATAALILGISMAKDGGALAIDSTSADGKYFVIAAEGNELIVENKSGIYKTGEQLIVDRLTTSTGKPAKTTIQTLTFDDTEAIAQLSQLQSANPNAAIYLSGTLTVDFPEDIKVQVDPATYPVIEVTGSNVKLSWCPSEKVLVYLKDQYAIGTVTAKIISPRP